MKNQQKFAIFLFLLAIIGLLTSHCTHGSDPVILPVEEGYKPDEPIEFPHDLHIQNGIDCKYCHNSANAEEKEGIQVVNTCMKCHK